jgi:TRAP-type C4-dicarboxylate transport system substrate-binding protein
MRRLQKHLRSVTAVAALGLVLAACGGGDDDSAAPDDPTATSTTTDGATPTEATPAEEITGPEVTLTLGHPFPASHPIQTGALEPFIEEVAEVTNGTVTIEVVPGGGLGPAPATYENTAIGAQDLGWALHGYTPGRFPLTEIVEMPFVFDSATEATEALWTLFEEFPELQAEYSDVHVLGLWTHDVGDLWTSGTQVTTADDVNGLTLRAPGPMQNELITQLGGSPVGMPAPEIFDALERGVIDGLMIANSGLESFNLYPVLDFGVQCNCYVAAQFLVVSQDAWDQLSPEQQAAVDEVGRRALSERAMAVYDDEYQLVADKLESEGIELTVLEGEELERWKEAGQAVAQAWIEAREAEGAPGRAMYDRLLELAGE